MSRERAPRGTRLPDRLTSPNRVRVGRRRCRRSSLRAWRTARILWQRSASVGQKPLHSGERVFPEGGRGVGLYFCDTGAQAAPFQVLDGTQNGPQVTLQVIRLARDDNVFASTCPAHRSLPRPGVAQLSGHDAAVALLDGLDAVHAAAPDRCRHFHRVVPGRRVPPFTEIGSWHALTVPARRGRLAPRFSCH